MSTDYVEETTASDGEPVALEQLAAAAGWSVEDVETTMTRGMRRIGAVGTALRATVGLGLLYLAGGADGLSWRVEWYDLVLGLVALPALTVVLGLAARRCALRPLRFTGPTGHALNCAVIAALVANPYTGAAATLFYGAALVGAAWRGAPGCEVTILSNWILRRDDQVGCPIFSPIDAVEAKRPTRAPRRPATARD